jgi:DNA-directed RNA polymerase specialized sigma24 family protein
VPGLRNDDDHAEAVQEVFLRAFEDQARLGYDGSVTYWTYLSAIARNVASDYYRRRHRRPRPSPRAESGAKRPAIAG